MTPKELADELRREIGPHGVQLCLGRKRVEACIAALRACETARLVANQCEAAASDIEDERARTAFLRMHQTLSAALAELEKVTP